MSIDEADHLNSEVAKAGYILADLLCSSLSPRDGTWDCARPTYIWEHNALCWLARNRGRIPLMNAWTGMLLDDGYPAKPFISGDGASREAGAWWNATMKPKADGLSEHWTDNAPDAKDK